MVNILEPADMVHLNFQKVLHKSLQKVLVEESSNIFNMEMGRHLNCRAVMFMKGAWESDVEAQDWIPLHFTLTG